MKIILVALSVLCALIACSGEDRAMGSGAGEQNAETEIKAAICASENGDFKAAQSTLEAVLKKDPKNIYALRLLPGIAARQIKAGDKSAENAARIRKAVELYESAAANPLLKNEREDINRYIIDLYGMIGGDEKAAALRKKAENESETPKLRAAYYVSLAADQYICANEISDVAPVKTVAKRGGKEVYVFRKPQNPADFERLKKCAAEGSELIGRAVALDAGSDTAWSYQASLFAQLARIAEIEGKPAEKARLMNEFETARTKFIEISRRRSDEQAKADEELSKSTNDERDTSPAALTEEQFRQLREELKSYRAERPLAETVDRVDMPSQLIEPVMPEDDPTERTGKTATTPAPLSDEKQKREWKPFAQAGGLSAELPGEAAVSSTGDSRIYTASGNGLAFFIIETSRPRDLLENEQDPALNVIAWVLTKYIGSRYTGEGGANSRFESDLTRKDRLNDRPARFYAYRMISCRENQEGTLIFVIGPKKNYAIDIRGAGESDERVRRFLKSLKLA